MCIRKCYGRFMQLGPDALDFMHVKTTALCETLFHDTFVFLSRKEPFIEK